MVDCRDYITFKAEHVDGRIREESLFLDAVTHYIAGK